MTTQAIMLAEIQADTGRTSTAQVTAMRNKIAAAIRQYQPKRFWFNESRSVTFNTVAATDTYAFGAGLAITTEFYKIDGVFITIAANDVRELVRRNAAEIEARVDSDTTTGEPSQYAFIDKALRLWRSPVAIYSTRLMGHVKLAAPLADDEANNAWMTEAYDLIMCRAKAELYAHRWEDPNNAQIMHMAESDAERRLLDVTHDKVALGHLEATEF